MVRFFSEICSCYEKLPTRSLLFLAGVEDIKIIAPISDAARLNWKKMERVMAKLLIASVELHLFFLLLYFG